jgi:hypothetical protein
MLQRLTAASQAASITFAVYSVLRDRIVSSSCCAFCTAVERSTRGTRHCCKLLEVVDTSTLLPLQHMHVHVYTATQS